jgi:alanine dehydrogenase
MTLLVTEDDIKQLPLSVKTAIPIMEDAFRLAGENAAENLPRLRMAFKNGFMQFGPGALHPQKLAGFKLWANFGRGKGVLKSDIGYGHTFLYSMETGELLAIVQAGHIGKFRTGAVTGVAAKYLSPKEASSIGIYGGGSIAEGQLEAVCAVRPIKTIKVYTRTRKNLEAFCARMSERLGTDVIPANAPEEVPRDADIVITASTAENPVLFGDWLTQPGLVVAAGANHWYKREIDGKVISRAQLVVTDDREQSRLESGNLMWAIDHGLITWNGVEELGNVVAGRVAVPDFKDANLLFASHGLATTQVAIAQKAYELALAGGMGTQIKI